MSATTMNGTATRKTSSMDRVKAVSTQVFTGSGSVWMAVTSRSDCEALPSCAYALLGTTSTR